MKIVHVAECAGGVEKYLRMLTPLLKEKGVSQTIVCSQNFVSSYFDNVVDTFYQVNMQQSFSPKIIVRTIKLIRKILKKENADIIYCHSSFGGCLGRVASIGLRAKVVYNPHGWSFNDQQISAVKRYSYIVIEKILSLFTDKYIAISNFEKQNALNYKISKSNEIVVIRNGLEIDKYKNRTKLSRKDLGIPEHSIVVGMVGRLTIGKSPFVFTRMAAILKKVIPSAYFIIVGDGEDKETTKKLIHSLGLDDCFLITGWVDNVYDYEDSFDYAVLLTRWEGFGLAVAEYMLCGKPLVSTNVGGIPDIVINGENGLLIDDIDERNAANAILRLYNNKDLACKLAQNGYLYAKKELDIVRTANEHYKLFQELLMNEIK